VDYPYVLTKGAENFILNSSLSDEDKEKFAHLNAKKLLNLEALLWLCYFWRLR